MSDLRPVGVPIDLGGVERHFLFTLNAIDAVESHYGCPVFEALGKITVSETQSEALRFFVATLVNDEAEREKWKNPESDRREGGSGRFSGPFAPGPGPAPPR